MRKVTLLCLVLCAAAMSLGACSASENVSYERPRNAVPGECWCLYTVPPVFKTVSEQVMVAPASYSYETIPAEYETRQERVMVKPETRQYHQIPAEYRTETYQALVKKECFRTEKIPAVYEERRERVVIKDESTRKVTIPAKYQSEEYRVCVEPARTEWRRADCQATNVSADVKQVADQCFCLVSIPGRFETRTRQVLVEKEHCVKEVVPAEYGWVTKKVCVQKECERKIAIPAVYETRTRQVCVKPASRSCEVIPAEFKTVERKVCVRNESRRRIEIPAKFETRERQVCVASARNEWRRTNCAPAAGSTISTAPPAENQNQKPLDTSVPSDNDND